MTMPDKSKNKPRLSHIRWVLLILLLGWLFAFQMPFVIVTPTGLHLLNYVIYWGATWAWLVPFTRWMKHNGQHSPLRRMSIFVLLLGLSAFLVLSGWAVSGRGILLPDANINHACDVGRNHDYTCYLPYVELPIADEDRYLELGSDYRMVTFIFTTRIRAEQIGELPIARVTEYGARTFRAEEIMRAYEANHPAP
jgi:hypothetical protein